MVGFIVEIQMMGVCKVSNKTEQINDKGLYD